MIYCIEIFMKVYKNSALFFSQEKGIISDEFDELISDAQFGSKETGL